MLLSLNSKINIGLVIIVSMASWVFQAHSHTRIPSVSGFTVMNDLLATFSEGFVFDCALRLTVSFSHHTEPALCCCKLGNVL